MIRLTFWLNVLLLQWLFVRLCVAYESDGSFAAWGLIYWSIPLSGVGSWGRWDDLICLNRPPMMWTLYNRMKEAAPLDLHLG